MKRETFIEQCKEAEFVPSFGMETLLFDVTEKVGGEVEAFTRELKAAGIEFTEQNTVHHHVICVPREQFDEEEDDTLPEGMPQIEVDGIDPLPSDRIEKMTEALLRQHCRKVEQNFNRLANLFIQYVRITTTAFMKVGLAHDESSPKA